MAKIKRIVSTSFWVDRKVMDEFSIDDRYFFLYLLTNPHTSQLGIYELSITTMANETGFNKDVVKVLLERFENRFGVIKYSVESGEIAIKNYLRHSIVSGGKPVFDCLSKELRSVSDISLVMYIYNSLSKRKDIENDTVLSFISFMGNYLKDNKENENDNNNDNDNDNERIVDESSGKVKKSIKNIIPPSFDMVQDYCFERNNGIDPESFIDYYTSRGWMLGKNKMKDWQAAIRLWERNRNKQKPKNEFSEWEDA